MITVTGRIRNQPVAGLVTPGQKRRQPSLGCPGQAPPLSGPSAADTSWTALTPRMPANTSGQYVWLKVDQLGDVRDPAVLPGWLATTTMRECSRSLRAARRLPAAGQALEASNIPDTQAATAEQELLRAERHAALREALACLPPGCQRLLALLTADPPVPYTQISAELGIPAGSIGPARGPLPAKAAPPPGPRRTDRCPTSQRGHSTAPAGSTTVTTISR
jgi:guanyl-specific ribonuclease Sa